MHTDHVALDGIINRIGDAEWTEPMRAYQTAIQEFDSVSAAL